MKITKKIHYKKDDKFFVGDYVFVELFTEDGDYIVEFNKDTDLECDSFIEGMSFALGEEILVVEEVKIADA